MPSMTMADAQDLVRRGFTVVSSASGAVYVLLTCWQVKLYGWRTWRRMGFGLGVDYQEAQEEAQALERHVEDAVKRALVELHRAEATEEVAE